MRANRGVAAVEFDRGCRKRHVHRAREFALEAEYGRLHLEIGCHGGGVDDAEVRPPRHHALAAFALDVDIHVNHDDVVSIVVRLRDGVAAVELDKQVMRMAGQEKVDRAR